MSVRQVIALAALYVLLPDARAADLPRVRDVERQPLAAQVDRLVEAMDLLGSPLSAGLQKFIAAAKDKADAAAVQEIQSALDGQCLAGVRITGPDKVEILPGQARPQVAEQGWRVFLVKVYNPTGVKGVELRADSPNALPLFTPSSNKPDPTVTPLGEVGKRFLELSMYNGQPLVKDLSGLELEYRLLQVYCRDAGRKEAQLGFSLWR